MATKNTSPEASGTAIPTLVEQHYQQFVMWSRFWFLIHYASGVLAVIAGGLATAAGAKSTVEFINGYAWLWGLAATLLSGVVTFLGPLQKGESYRHAHFYLSSALARFQAGEITVKALNDECDKAKSMVLLGDPNAVHPGLAPAGKP